MSSPEPQLLRRGGVLSSGQNATHAVKHRDDGVGGAVYILAEEAFDFVYGPEERAAVSARVRAQEQLITPGDYHASTEVWPDVEMIFCGWGMVPMDEDFYRRFPKVKVVFYAAGTVRSIVTDLFWRNKTRLTNAAAANAVPVSEFTVSQILFALKHGWQHALHIRKHRKFPPPSVPAGAYHSTVGIISLGEIGRLVAERLQHFDLEAVAYDPFFPPEKASRLGVRLVSLEELFAVSDVVTCHTPLLKETEGLIRRRHFMAMKPGSTFINTARGAVVDEAEMIAALQERPDIFALLDVTEPLPPVEGSPLYTMDNVILTPHIAGSLGPECRRMGRLMVEELDRFLDGKPLRYEINEKRFHSMA